MNISRFELAFEQKETWRVSRGENVETQLCPICREASPMIGAEYLAKVMATSPREVYRKVDSGLLHFVETVEMQVLVCLRSFSNSVVLGKAECYQEVMKKEFRI